WWGWSLVVFGGAGILVALWLAIVTWPYDLVAQGKASGDAYLKAITDTRATLVQAIAGVAVALGSLVGIVGLVNNRHQHEDTLNASRLALEQNLTFNRDSLTRTLAVTERGQITDRFSS